MPGLEVVALVTGINSAFTDVATYFQEHKKISKKGCSGGMNQDVSEAHYRWGRRKYRESMTVTLQGWGNGLLLVTPFLWTQPELERRCFNGSDSYLHCGRIIQRYPAPLWQ
jgi:hypothetical protein